MNTDSWINLPGGVKGRGGAFSYVNHRMDESLRPVYAFQETHNRLVIMLAHSRENLDGILMVILVCLAGVGAVIITGSGLIIQRSVKQGLTDSLLMLARIDAGNMTVAMDDLNLEALVARIVKQHDPEKGARNLEAVINCSGKPVIHTDRTLLTTVFTNIISNALSYSPDGTTTEVSLSELETGYCLRVSNPVAKDLSPDDLSRMFEPSWRKDEARGGYFEDLPAEYPAEAWYRYDDDTCDYSCQVTEYTYWALTSILGAQEFEGRLDEIREEWRLNTREKVKQGDPDIYDILTDSTYSLPGTLPDGNYTGGSLSVKAL